MHNAGTGIEGSVVRGFKIIDLKCDLRTSRGSPIPRLVQREVQKRTIGPGRSRVPTARPQVVAFVIGEVKVKGEGVAIQRSRSVKVRDRKYDCDESLRGAIHEEFIMP